MMNDQFFTRFIRNTYIALKNYNKNIVDAIIFMNNKKVDILDILDKYIEIKRNDSIYEI